MKVKIPFFYGFKNLFFSEYNQSVFVVNTIFRILTLKLKNKI